jgi:mannosyltransferase OCH1-like enzyme
MIEKNIFQSWHTKTLHTAVKNEIEIFKKKNPEYEYKLYTDEDMDKFVNKHYIGEIADCYNKLNIIVAKVDFWRYLALYKYGGIYLDMDSSIVEPLRNLISDDDDAIITAEGNPNLYVQWALIFSKQHPILKTTIDLIIDNIKNNKYPNDIHKTTGPTVYSKAINKVHNSLYKDGLVHKSINKYTNITYISGNIKYRIYGIDYNNYFCFKHKATCFLYTNKKHWRQEEKEKELIKHN